MNASDIARFVSKVDVSSGIDGCHPYTSGHRTRNALDYGGFWLDGRTELAHRVAWRIAFGDIPAGQQIRHTCDFPPCCNPQHLLLGDARANAKDREEHGGGVRRGTDHHNAKMSETTVRRARALRLRGWSWHRIATKLKVSRSTVSRAATGETWAHLGEPPRLPRTVHVSQETLDEAQRLRSAGRSWQEVELAIGYGRKTLTRWWRRS